MKHSISTLVIGLCLIATTTFATTTLSQPSKDNAEATVIAFAELVNQNNLEAAYYSGSEYLQISVPEGEWVDKVHRTFILLGKIKTRTPIKTRPVTSFSGLPDDKYLLVHNQIETERKKKANEVALLRVENGQWKVCDYSVR